MNRCQGPPRPLESSNIVLAGEGAIHPTGGVIKFLSGLLILLYVYFGVEITPPYCAWHKQLLRALLRSIPKWSETL